MLIKTEVLLCSSLLFACFKVFIYLLFGFMGVLGAACGIYFPVQRFNPGPLHCQCRVLATGKFSGILFVLFWGGTFVWVSFSFLAKVGKEERGRNCVNKCGTGNELTFWLYFQRTCSLWKPFVCIISYIVKRKW